MALLTPETVFRRYETMGVPESGPHEPKKAEIIQLLNQLFGTSRGGWVVARTVAELNSITPQDETDGGVVLTGTGAGYYDRDSGGWVFGRPFPDTFAKVMLSGSGTVQTGIVNTGVNPASIEVFFAKVVTPNTGAMTLSIAGETAKPVVNIAGSALSAGEWTGMVMFYLNDANQYQLLIDAGAAAAAAASAALSKTYRDEAEAFAALLGGAVAISFNTVAILFADTSLGYSGSGAAREVNVGDVVSGGGFRYSVAAAGASNNDVATAGGVKLYVLQLNAGGYDLRAWGCSDDETVDDSALINTALASGIEGVIRLPKTEISVSIKPKSRQHILGGKLVGETNYFAPTDGTANGFYIFEADDVTIEGVEITGDVDMGIRTAKTRRLRIVRNHIHGIGFSTAAFERGHGITIGNYVVNGDYNFDVEIAGNTIENVGGVGILRGDGVLVSDAADVRITGNRIANANRMGVAIVSGCRDVIVSNNHIVDPLLACVDVEPDADHGSFSEAYNVVVSDNTLSGFGRDYDIPADAPFAGAQLFAVDFHTYSHDCSAIGNIITPGGRAKEIFHAQNGAYNLTFSDNQVKFGPTVDFFLVTFAGSGADNIIVTGNVALGGNIKSFINAYDTNRITVANNLFSGTGEAGSFFFYGADCSQVVIANNQASAVANFIAGGFGICSNWTATANVALGLLGNGVDILASGAGIENVVITGNTLHTPGPSTGVKVEYSSGYLRKIVVSNNVLPTSGTLVTVSGAATSVTNTGNV